MKAVVIPFVVIRRAVDATIVVLAAALLLILALGGVDYSWGAAHIRLHDWHRPLALLLAAAGARGALGVRGAGGAGGARGARDALSRYVATHGLLALLLAAAAMYATYQVRVCGGLDSYGYVSTASLMASGHLTERQPLVPLLPFEHASAAAAPLGYVAGVAVSQLYLAARVWVRLVFLASEVSLFQNRLAAAGYIAVPLAPRAEPPIVEQLVSEIRR